LETYLFIATYGASIEGDLLIGRHPGLYCALKNRQQSRPAAFGTATPGKRSTRRRRCRVVRPSFYFGNSNIPSNSDKHIYGFTMKFRVPAKIA
jgi:hypothetical protein